MTKSCQSLHFNVVRESFFHNFTVVDWLMDGWTLHYCLAQDCFNIVLPYWHFLWGKLQIRLVKAKKVCSIHDTLCQLTQYMIPSVSWQHIIKALKWQSRCFSHWSYPVSAVSDESMNSSFVHQEVILGAIKFLQEMGSSWRFVRLLFCMVALGVRDTWIFAKFPRCVR